MLKRRIALALMLVLVVGGAVGGTLGYGMYQRSEMYRRDVQEALSRFFGLPLEVQTIGPHSFSARQLSGIDMWLPDRRARMFHAPRALWDTGGADGIPGTAIHIFDAQLTIGTEEWEKEDYMRVLRASLAHNFREFDIRQVVFHNARIHWVRRDFRLRAEGVEGNVVFDDAGIGHVKFLAASLNGATMAEPVQIFARVDPSLDDFIPEVTLVAPRLPLSVLQLDQALGSKVTQGQFAGKVTLRQSDGRDALAFSGAARQVRLEELTHRLAGGPLVGAVDLVIEEGAVEDRVLQALRFRGHAEALDMNALLTRFGLPPIGGTLELSVEGGHVEREVLRRIWVTGAWTGGSLEALARAVLGRGGLTGRLLVRVNALTIRDNQVVSGDIDVLAEPPAGGRGTIERALLLDVLQKQLGLALPTTVTALMPAQLEFTRIGVKLTINNNLVRVLPLDGPAGPALITLRMLGRDMPLLSDLDRTFSLEPFLNQAHPRIDEWREELRRRLSRNPAPATNTAPARR